MSAPSDVRAARAATAVERVATILVRYGELTLKGGNRALFERALEQNVRGAALPIAPVRVERARGRMYVHPEARAADVMARLQSVFGISSLSPAWSAPPEREAIAALAERVLARALERMPETEPIPFRVSTSRADKTFPLVSSELDRFVADRVLPIHGDRLRVNLSEPRLSLGIEVRPDRAWVFAERVPGAGGLPVGTLGRALCLLSGGIDSPVAAWLTMKRGAEVAFVSYHSEPYLGPSSKRKIRRLVAELARWQPRSRLFVVPFADAQEAIRDRAPEPYRTVLYRRMMQRIASRIAEREGAGALVTGESLGQVASQTMENLTCIADASRLPVLRPLIAFDKDETIALARRIGTYAISCEPEPDCCTVFQPRRPVIRGRIDRCARAERRIDVGAIVEGALAGVESIDVSP